MSAPASAGYRGLASVFERQDNLPAAILAYRRAIELDPESASVAWYNLGLLLARQNKLPEAIAAYRKAIAQSPEWAWPKNNLAWLLATASDAGLRDPSEAVALAKRAVQLRPQGYSLWNTLGVAHYRAGNSKEAIAAQAKSMELRQGDGDSWNYFFLAMAHWRLGEKDRAREWYDQAVEWMDKNEPKNEELRRFRAEAAELLKVEEKK
jgi:superkiller protein 3